MRIGKNTQLGKFFAAPSFPHRYNDDNMQANLTAAAASAIKNSQISNEAAATVAAKALRVQEAQGRAAVSLVQQAEQLTKQLAAGRIDVQL